MGTRLQLAMGPRARFRKPAAYATEEIENAEKRHATTIAWLTRARHWLAGMVLRWVLLYDAGSRGTYLVAPISFDLE